MGKPTSRRLSAEQRQELWRMWRAGRTHQEIAWRMNISKPSVFLYIERRGGIEPPERRRSALALPWLRQNPTARPAQLIVVVRFCLSEICGAISYHR